jgi:hypothetical protein
LAPAAFDACPSAIALYTTAQITEFETVLPVETVHPAYHLFRRGIEADLLPYAQAHDIGVLAYGPLPHELLGGAITASVSCSWSPCSWRSWIRRSDVPARPVLGPPS